VFRCIIRCTQDTLEVLPTLSDWIAGLGKSFVTLTVADSLELLVWVVTSGLPARFFVGCLDLPLAGAGGNDRFVFGFG
jgi:hypothetical protein